MPALREVAAFFGVQVDDKPLVDLDLRIREVLGSVRRLAAAAPGSEAAKAAAEDVEILKGVTTRFVGVVALAGFALHRFAESVSAQAHELRATAAELRVTTDQLQSVRTGLQLAGLSAQDADRAFSTFHGNLRAAATQGGDAGGVFYRLGIRLRDGNRQVRNSADVLNEVAERFGKIQNPARAARYATQLFGAVGLQLLPVLHRGAGGIAELRKEFEALGGGLNAEAIEAARRYEAAMTRWRIVGDATRAQLAIGLLPALTFLVDKARQLQLWFTRLFVHTHGVRNALGILGAVGAAVAAALIVAWFPVIAPFLAATVALTALYLIVDDFVTFLEGGRSVIGAFIDELFGAGTAEKVRQQLVMIGELREAWDGLKLAIHDALAAVGLADSQSATDRQNASDASIRASALRRQAELARQRAAINPALNGPAAAAGTIPIAVRAPARAAAPVQRTTQQTNHFNIRGQNPREIAEQVRRVVREQMQTQHDADHPLQPRDE